MPDYKMFQLIVTALALLYLYVKSRQVARDGQSTMPEIVQIALWGGALILGFYVPERILGVPYFVLALLAIVLVSTRLNYWRLQQQRAAYQEKLRREQAKMAGEEQETSADDETGLEK